MIFLLKMSLKHASINILGQKGKILVGALCIYSLTFWICLPACLKNVPYSVFHVHNNTHHYRKIYDNIIAETNKIRYEKSLQYLQYQTHQDKTKSTHNSEPLRSGDFVVGVITTRREKGESNDFSKTGYLTQVVSSLIRYGDNNRLVVCNVDAEPGKHTEVDINIASHVAVYSPTAKTPTKSKKINIEELYEKEKQDYIFCMTKLLEFKTSHILVQEDDALPVKEFYYVIRNFITDHDFDFLKLYYKPRWSGFSNSVQHYLELLQIGLIGGLTNVLSFILLKLLKHMKWLSRRITKKTLHFNKSIMILLFTIGAIYFICIAVCINRPTLLQLKQALLANPYTWAYAPGCCTQSIIYKRQVAQNLIQYLSSVSCNQSFPVDVALHNFKIKEQLKAYIIEPNLVDHIGVKSILKGDRNDINEFIINHLFE